MAFSTETRQKIKDLKLEAALDKEKVRGTFAETRAQQADKRGKIRELNSDLEDAIDATKTADREAQESKEPKENPLAPVKLRRIVEWLYDTHFSHNGEPTLRRWKENWWRWLDGVWSIQKKSDLESEIFKLATLPEDEDGFGQTYFPYYARQELMMLLWGHLKSLEDDREFESWLPVTSRESAEIDTSGTWVNCDKGLIKVADTTAYDLARHTPRYFTPCRISRNIDDSCPPTRWLSFLDQVLEHDTDRIAVLQEWFGYCCLPTTRYQRMLLLVGPGGNGKSVVLHVLAQMLGKRNCSNVELSDMNKTFGPISTFGKVANICGDIATKYLKNPGRLKAFVGGDTVKFEQKHMASFSTQPTAKLIFSMNDLPKTDDESEGFMRRMLPIPFNYTPPESDPIFANPKNPKWPFRPELDRIFVWALEGLIRLLRRDAFTESPIIKRALAEWRFHNEGVRRYAEERLDFSSGAGFSTPCHFISDDYVKWSKRNGEHPFSAQGLGKRLRRIYPRLETVRKQIGTKREFYWQDLRLHQEAPILGD